MSLKSSPTATTVTQRVKTSKRIKKEYFEAICPRQNSIYIDVFGTKCGKFIQNSYSGGKNGFGTCVLELITVFRDLVDKKKRNALLKMSPTGIRKFKFAPMK